MAPRRVNVFTEYLRVDTNWVSNTPAPAVMHVCRDARAHAPYTRAFCTSSSAARKANERYVWVNFDVDMIVLLTTGIGDSQLDPLDLLASSPCADQIQRLRVPFAQDCPDSYEAFMVFLDLKLQPFRFLRELQIVMAEDDIESCSAVTWNNDRFGSCSPDQVHFLDARTGLLLSRGDVEVLLHWGIYDGGLVRSDEVANFDEYAEQYHCSWVAQMEDAKRLQGVGLDNGSR